MWQAAGIMACVYHAGLDPADRESIQRQWLDGAVPVMCATIAFGMGIDKSNVRYGSICLFVTELLEFFELKTARII